MGPGAYSEDTLVQQTAADYLNKELGWESGPGLYNWTMPDFTIRRSNHPAL